MKRNAVSLLKEVKGGILIVNGEESLHQKIVNSLADPGHRVEITTSSNWIWKSCGAKTMKWFS